MVRTRTSTVTVTTVIFDFGGVFTASPLAAFRSAAGRVGVDPDALIELMTGGYELESDHPWQRVERGELSLDEARTWARLETQFRLGLEIDPSEVLAPLLGEPLRQSMIDLVRELRHEGVTVGLLTNNARELRDQWGSMADWGALFDQVIDSSEVGVRKLLAVAFQLALDRCGEPEPGRAVMVDDLRVNVAGARSVGMRALLVGEDPGPAIAKVKALVQS